MMDSVNNKARQSGRSGKLSPRKPQKGLSKNIFFYILIGFLILSTLFTLSTDSSQGEEKPISEILELVAGDQVKEVEVLGDLVVATLKDDSQVFARKETGDPFLEILSRHEISVSQIEGGVKISEGFPWADLLLDLLPIGLTILFFVWIFRQSRMAGSEMLSFGKSRARLFTKDRPSIKFSDVAGADEAKRELLEVVDFLKYPGRYRKLGARVPRGVLLVGPPGVGKTMLARAVAAEAKVPFFNIAGSEFMEMLVGVGASRVRDLFGTAKRSSPSLIFIDELEAIGGQRGAGFMGGHAERDQTLNQILVEMDGFNPRTNVIVIAATNRPDLLDPALMRPGRFDRRIVLELPDIKERGEIIKIHMRGKPFAKGVNVSRLAQRTVGFSGADIENMLNEAAILAARERKKSISAADLEEAATKVKLGPQRKRLQSEEDKKMVAYHEAGHALVSSQLPLMDPVHRISIVARGMSLGHTMIPPKIDRYNETKSRLLEQITALLGGRAAEEIKFNENTVGAAADIDQATGLARQMVTEFGMSELGPIAFDGRQDRFLRMFGRGSAPSEGMAEKIDQEVKKIIDACFKRAKEILKKNEDKLDKVAKRLIKAETIEGEQFFKLIK